MSASKGKLAQLRRSRGVRLWSLVWLLGACTNNPYPEAADDEKVLYASFTEAPRTLDPAVAYTTTSHKITGKVYDTLLEYHYLKRPYQLIPGLAARVPQAEPLEDGRVRYRFELRDDVLYQEDPCFELGLPGRKTRQVVAEDVAFELMRLADPEVNSPVTQPFSNVAGFDAFGKRLKQLAADREGFRELPARERYAEAGGIDGVRVDGKLGLEIVLARPYPQILYWFAMPFSTPLPWEAVAYYDGQGDRPHLSDTAVGSGPFVLSEYDKQSRIVLDKNPNWYGVRHPEWDAPGATYPSEGEPEDEATGLLKRSVVGSPLPFLERVEYRREKEDIPAFAKFLQGYYDQSGIIHESFDQVIKGKQLSEEMRAMGMQLEQTIMPDIYYIGFNMDNEVVGSPGGERSRKLRQAMSLVVDAKEYCRLFLNGRGVPAQSLLPPGLFGYDPDYDNPFRSVDFERAKKLLAEAGYDGGIDPRTGEPLELTFDTGDTSPSGRLRYQFHINAWRRLGLDVELAATTYNKFQEKVRNGAYQIFSWGWVADYPDPENFYFLLWSKMSRTESGGPNTANFSDPHYDELFLQMRSLRNSDQRLELIRQMRAILERERPWIELFHRENYVLAHRWVKHLKPMGLSTPTTKYLDIDVADRIEAREAWNQPVMWPAYVLLALAVVVVVPGIRTFLRERQ